jgi:hypothetical protein
VKCERNPDEADFVGAVADNTCLVIGINVNDFRFDARNVPCGSGTRAVPDSQTEIGRSSHVSVFIGLARSWNLHGVKADVVSRTRIDVTDGDLPVAFGRQVALDKHVYAKTISNKNSESLGHNSIKCLQRTWRQEFDRARSRNKNRRLRHKESPQAESGSCGRSKIFAFRTRPYGVLRLGVEVNLLSCV